MTATKSLTMTTLLLAVTLLPLNSAFAQNERPAQSQRYRMGLGGIRDQIVIGELISDEATRNVEARLNQAVASGEMTEDQARHRWESYQTVRSAREQRMDAERMSQHLREAVEAGEMTEEQARERLNRYREQMEAREQQTQQRIERQQQHLRGTEEQLQNMEERTQQRIQHQQQRTQGTEEQMQSMEERARERLQHQQQMLQGTPEQFEERNQERRQRQQQQIHRQSQPQ